MFCWITNNSYLYLVKTDFSLAPAQQCCLNQTQKEAELSLLEEFFNCFQKIMLLPRVCAVLNAGSFSELGWEQGQARWWQWMLHWCIYWLSGCVLHGGTDFHTFLTEVKTLLFAAELWAKSTVRESSCGFLLSRYILWPFLQHVMASHSKILV